LNTGTRAVCFHKEGKVALVTLKLKVNSGVNTSEQPLIMKEGIPSSPAHLEDLSRLISLITLAAEIGAVGKRSEDIRLEGVIGL
jgi:hypothetical protein